MDCIGTFEDKPPWIICNYINNINHDQDDTKYIDDELVNDEEIGNNNNNNNDKDEFELELPFRNADEHHVAVYAAIRTAFLECLRDFAPKDMQNVDIEDICAAYIDTQKRVCFVVVVVVYIHWP